MLKKLVYVDTSPIHGRGVFARKTIKRGRRIGCYEGKKTKENDTYVLWTQDENGKDIGIDGRNMLKYLNHSDEPNAEFSDELELIAIRRIHPGDEITFHYGDDWE